MYHRLTFNIKLVIPILLGKYDNLDEQYLSPRNWARSSWNRNKMFIWGTRWFLGIFLLIEVTFTQKFRM